MADGGQHGEEHVAVPAVPASGLVVVKAELVLGRLGRILGAPAAAFNRHRRFDASSGRAPRGETSQCPVAGVAPDQQAARPGAGKGGVELIGIGAGQLQAGPVLSSLACPTPRKAA